MVTVVVGGREALQLPLSSARETDATNPAVPAAPAKLAKAPHVVRIIGGQWKRTRLAVADKPGLRPTPDRVRETLFNWLASLAGAGGGELPGWHCVDAFAGTGALGLEAASRGAASVLLCEQDAGAGRAAAGAEDQARGRGGAHRARQRRHGAGARAGRQRACGLPRSAVRERRPVRAGAARRGARAARPMAWSTSRRPRRWSDEELAALGLVGYRYLKAGAVHAHLLQPAPDAAA